MASAGKSAAEVLATPVQYLRGVGPHRAEILDRIGLRAVRDVLFYFPRDYEDLTRLCKIDDLVEGEPASVCGTVEEVDFRDLRGGRTLFGVLIRQDAGWLRGVWFNQPHLKLRFAAGQRVVLSGDPKYAGGRWEMVHPRHEFLAHEEEPPPGKILPIYSLTEGLSQTHMRQIVLGAVEQFSPLLEEVLPEEYLDAHGIWPIHAALPQIHTPGDMACLAQARRRFIYQELLVLQLGLGMRRGKLTRHGRATPLPNDARIDTRILRLFPFAPTDDQRTAIDEIAADMAQPFPMNRLLQGDVGSGKTFVAMYAMLLAVAHGRQAALMAPTETLARQHVRSLQRALAASRVRIGLLVGSLTAAQRRDVLERAAEGSVDLVVGTHSLLQSEVKFAKLSLVIIDEQHKFGVEQRAALRHAGDDPHYLVMTATPIPRTVAMTLFGDLVVSTIRQPPPGRKPVHTYLGNDERRPKWWDFVRRKLQEGRQAFVIAPLVDESDSLEVASAEKLFESLSNGELGDFKLGLLHGRLDADVKDATLLAFEKHQLDVLVATPVVEVGIDVPNATLMTIEGGERFGMSQLHQLRGRVSRGKHPGFVCVFADLKNPAAEERLKTFVVNSDGFALAEADLRLRGPGDFFSARQHGMPPLRIADLVRDAAVVDEARRDAQALLADDADLAAPAFARLRRMVLARYGHALELGDVG